MTSKRRAIAILLILTVLGAGCGVSPTTRPGPDLRPVEVVPKSYFTGTELAQQIMRNVVLLNYPDRQEHGSGLVVGRDGVNYVIVTARHVVRAPGQPNALVQKVQVRFCGDGVGMRTFMGTPEQITGAQATDIALVRVVADSLLPFETKILATQGTPQSGEQAWIAGREGRCMIGGSEGGIEGRGFVEEGSGPDASIRAYVPNSNPSSSGAALMTSRGVVGIVQYRVAAQYKVSATDIYAVRQAAQAHDSSIWKIQDSGNLSPGTYDAASRELNEVLVSYLFSAKTNRDVNSLGTLNQGALESAVHTYNIAINRYKAVQSKHDATLARVWGCPTLGLYQQVRREVLALHAIFLGMSGDGLVNEMYRTLVVPEAVKARMTVASTQIDVLQVDVDRFLAAVAKVPTSVDLKPAYQCDAQSLGGRD